MDFLAKSDGETIIQHTLNLKKQFEKLRKYYPNSLKKKETELLLLACLYHDLGKMNKKFQDKVSKNRHIMEDHEIPHALLSVCLLPIDRLSESFSKDELIALSYAIAYHHERNFENLENYYPQEVELLEEQALKFNFKGLDIKPVIPPEIRKRYFKLGYRPNTSKTWYPLYVKIKGLLNRIDYAASGHYEVEEPAGPFLKESLNNNLMVNWKEHDPNAKWNAVQKWMEKNSVENVVVVAQTGIGKTEASLKWIGEDKGFYTLPLKAAINGIFQRIKRDIVPKNADYRSHVGILHSDMTKVLFADQEYQDKLRLEDFDTYINETKKWSLPLTITTLDQIFNMVYRYRGYEYKLATLSYSKVVIDEIQMYSADLLAYLIVGLSMIQEAGGKFAIVTATLSPFILDLFKENKLQFKSPEKPFLDDTLAHRHSLKICHGELNKISILDSFNNNKVLVICNTVNQAIKIYDDLLQENKALTGKLHLIHSRFIKRDRARIEAEILNFGKTNNVESGIWIGTQVVEASLDIDFDVLYTELSELNSLFQRMGRCYRKRNFNGKYNIFVFDGGTRLPSGIKKENGFANNSIYDYTMFKLSKNALANLDGPISEEEKLNLIDNCYNTETLKESNYLAQVKKSIDYIRASENDGRTLQDTISRFRDIDSFEMIPENVYKDNIALFKELANLKYDRDQYSRIRMRRLDLFNQIDDLTVQVPGYIIFNLSKEHRDISEVQLSKFKSIKILPNSFEYDEKKGLNLKLIDLKKDESSNFF